MGFGNVNFHLSKVLNQAESIAVKQVYNRNQISLPDHLAAVPFTTELSELIEADVYLIGIPDDAIAAFSEKLPFQNRLVVHTSGGVGIDKLADKNRKGIFYPLQTFSKQRPVDFKTIPICVEAENTEGLVLLKKLGECISEKVVEISSEERAKLHLAAVFVNNFTNHLYQIGHNILEENKLSFDLLKPLIQETANKIESLSPTQAQTGPAKRNDLKTIEKHLHLLEGSPVNKEFYELFTKALRKEG